MSIVLIGLGTPSLQTWENVSAEIIPIIKWTFIVFDEEDDKPQYFAESI